MAHTYGAGVVFKSLKRVFASQQIWCFSPNTNHQNLNVVTYFTQCHAICKPRKSSCVCTRCQNEGGILLCSRLAYLDIFLQDANNVEIEFY